MNTKSNPPSPLAPFAPLGFEEAGPDDRFDLDWQVARVQRQISAVFRAAIANGALQPTGFVARVDRFAGLAFARELRGDRALRGLPRLDAPLVGCEPKNVIVCALLACDPEASRALLELELDPQTECPLVVLDDRARVVTVSLWSMLDERAA